MLKMFNDANTTLCNKHRYIDYKHVNFQKWSIHTECLNLAEAS